MRVRYKDILIFLILAISVGLGVSFPVNGLVIFLKDSDVSNKYISLILTIRMVTLVKFLWIPLIKKFNQSALSEKLGGEKTSIIVNQLLFCVAIISLGFFDPKEHKLLIFVISAALMVCVANKSILISSFRINFFLTNEQNISTFVDRVGSRIGTIITGVLLLLFLDYACIFLKICGGEKWLIAYFILAVISFTITIICLCFIPHSIKSRTKIAMIPLYKEYFKIIKNFFSKKKQILFSGSIFFIKQVQHRYGYF